MFSFVLHIIAIHFARQCGSPLGLLLPCPWLANPFEACPRGSAQPLGSRLRWGCCEAVALPSLGSCSAVGPGLWEPVCPGACETRGGGGRRWPQVQQSRTAAIVAGVAGVACFRNCSWSVLWPGSLGKHSRSDPPVGLAKGQSDWRHHRDPPDFVVPSTSRGIRCMCVC